MSSDNEEDEEHMDIEIMGMDREVEHSDKEKKIVTSARTATTRTSVRTMKRIKITMREKSRRIL